MNKKKTGRKFHRKTDQRRAFLKALANSLILREKMKTTEARAKEISSFLEKKITIAKKGGLSAQKLLLKTFSKQAVSKLLKEIAVRFKERKGGYSRIIKLGKKQSDSSDMVQIELLK
jgi:large subunit ribosomal protein L17